MAEHGNKGQAPVVWLLTDNKPGHRNQLRGLAERLQARAGAHGVWINASDHPVSLIQALLGRAPGIDAPAPDLIIAAGTGTQRLLLACRRLGALTVVLMRPSFPLAWCDLAIIPAHDEPPQRPDILVTRGVLNAVVPQTVPVHDPRGLMLLGGPSRHYRWDDAHVYQQVRTLTEEYPEWHWTVTTSRRTPAELVDRLRALTRPNLQYLHHQQTPPSWLPETLAASRVAWVTPDSVSMVYEAITTGLPTGLFDLAPIQGSRIARGVQGLLTDGMAAPWCTRRVLMATEPGQRPTLWEADRAAQWLLEQYKEHR
jgi:mitochondrial fission protein ELM1